MAGLPQTIKLPAKPPLSRICRLLRQEVLPIFYATLEFEIHLKQHSQDLTRYIEEHTTQLFLPNLAPADVACIRRFRVVINRRDSYALNRVNPRTYLKQMWFHIDLDRKECQFDVEQWDASSRLEWWNRKSLVLLRESIRQLIENLDDTNGRKAFTLQDIHQMRTLVEKQGRLILR